MQGTYIQAGAVVDYTPGAAVVAGQVVVQENLVGIALNPIAASTLGSLAVSGIFDVDQNEEVIVAGDAVYWDANGSSVGGTAEAGAATATASGNTFMGFCETLTAADTEKVRIRLVSAEVVAGAVATATSITGTASTLPVAGLEAAQGGSISVTGGVSTTAGNAGGAASVTGGVGGATGAGGAASLVGGASGAAAIGGAVAVTGGAGGSTSGAGGAVALTGGAASSAAGNAAGGAISVTGGAGKGSSAGGASSVVGGVAGLTGAGGAIAITGGAGGATSGTGGAVVAAGGAGSGGNANGGAISVLGGNANGSGTDGVANLGTSNTSAVNIGATSIATVFAGPVVMGIGANTIALGTTTADAATLPAATASHYPTTAADDAVGVIIHASDKVTGRTLFIGNGVSNKILKVYPPTGGTINGAASNAAFSSASGKGVIITCLSSGSNTWLAW